MLRAKISYFAFALATLIVVVVASHIANLFSFSAHPKPDPAASLTAAPLRSPPGHLSEVGDAPSQTLGPLILPGRVATSARNPDVKETYVSEMGGIDQSTQLADVTLPGPVQTSTLSSTHGTRALEQQPTTPTAPGTARASKKTTGTVSNLAVYIATTFSTGGIGNEPLIESRGRLILEWATRIETVILVTDVPADQSALDAFSRRNGCHNMDNAVAVGSSSSRASYSLLRCTNWEVLLTSCASIKWGADGPCCKFDSAAVHYFSLLAESSKKVSIDWFLFSDDDLYIRPNILQQFLGLFDFKRELVFGATEAGPRFRDYRKTSRTARGVCRRETRGCAHTLLWSWDNLRLSPGDTCRKPPKPLRRIHPAVDNTTTTTTTTEEKKNTTTAAQTLLLRHAGMTGSHSEDGGIAGGWKPCKSPDLANTCEACISKTAAAIAECMGPHQVGCHKAPLVLAWELRAFFPGNLQPFIASAGAMRKMESTLKLGSTLQSICREWSVTHDGGLVFLVWMLRIRYIEAARTCGAYVFAKKQASRSSSPGTARGQASVALIDRVKTAADLGANQHKAPERRAQELRGSSSSLGQTVEDENSWVAVWGVCLAAGNFRAAREIDLSLVEHTQWWNRTRNGTHLISPLGGAGAGAGTDTPGEGFAGLVEQPEKADIFTVSDCRLHVRREVPMKDALPVPETAPRGPVALRAEIQQMLRPWVHIIPRPLAIDEAAVAAATVVRI